MTATKFTNGVTIIKIMNVFELKFLDFIADHLRCGFLDFLMPKITMLGDAGIFWIALAVILLFPKKTRKIGTAMGIALVLGLVFCNITIKPLVARVRPYDVAGTLPYLTDVQHDFSFPSGHTVASFEGATVLFLYNKKWGIAALVLAALIAFSRMYLYVHYPTDILCGLVLGVLFAVAGKWASEKLWKKFETRKKDA